VPRSLLWIQEGEVRIFRIRKIDGPTSLAGGACLNGRVSKTSGVVGEGGLPPPPFPPCCNERRRRRGGSGIHLPSERGFWTRPSHLGSGGKPMIRRGARPVTRPDPGLLHRRAAAEGPRRPPATPPHNGGRLFVGDVLDETRARSAKRVSECEWG